MSNYTSIVIAGLHQYEPLDLRFCCEGCAGGADHNRCPADWCEGLVPLRGRRRLLPVNNGSALVGDWNYVPPAHGPLLEAVQAHLRADSWPHRALVLAEHEEGGEILVEVTQDHIRVLWDAEPSAPSRADMAAYLALEGPHQPWQGAEQQWANRALLARVVLPT